MLIDDRQKRQIRETELARFERWFVDTALGPAYRGRDGRARGVKAEEVARWRADVEAHVEAMIAAVPAQAAWMVGSALVIIFGGRWLLDLIAIPARYHGPAIGLATFIAEAGLFGIEAWDYIAGWRRRRDAIEGAVAARAPLPIEPSRLGSGRNWFRLASGAVLAPVLLLAFFSHLDGKLVERVDWRWLFAAVPLAWALHLAGTWYDGRMKSLRP